MDKDVTSDDVVGEGTFDISGAYTHPNQPRTCKIFCGYTVPIDLVFGGKPAGKLLVNVEFKAAGW